MREEERRSRHSVRVKQMATRPLGEAGSWSVLAQLFGRRPPSQQLYQISRTCIPLFPGAQSHQPHLHPALSWCRRCSPRTSRA